MAGLPAWLQDRRAQVAIGVGGLAGVYVLVRRRGASPGGISDAQLAAGSSGSTGQGYGTFNDGGSDLAATLGNFQTGLQGILQGYVNSAGTAVPTPVAKTPRPQDYAHGYQTIVRPVDLREVARERGMTVATLLKLNPGITSATQLLAPGQKVQFSDTPTAVAGGLIMPYRPPPKPKATTVRKS